MKQPTLLSACKAFTRFSFDDWYGKYSYQAALHKFCELKRNARKAISLSRKRATSSVR